LNGAAYASVISQGIALAMALIYLNRKNHLIAIKFRTFGLDKHLTALIFKIGFPSMIQQSLISIGSAFVTTYVNYFGAPAIAAFGAANRIDMVATMPAIAIGMAATALTGQNLGAGKPERVKEIFKWGVIIGTSISGIIAILSVSIPRLILSMFIHHQAVLDIGILYLRIVGPSYLFFSLMFVAQGVINGAGQTIITMIFSLLTLWVIRVPMAAYLSGTSLGPTGIWIAIALSFVIGSTISWLYYCTGRWKKAAGKIQSPSIIVPEPIE
jgi:putative MATE family efflux protein